MLPVKYPAKSFNDDNKINLNLCISLEEYLVKDDICLLLNVCEELDQLARSLIPSKLKEIDGNIKKYKLLSNVSKGDVPLFKAKTVHNSDQILSKVWDSCGESIDIGKVKIDDKVQMLVQPAGYSAFLDSVAKVNHFKVYSLWRIHQLVSYGSDNLFLGRILVSKRGQGGAHKGGEGKGGKGSKYKAEASAKEGDVSANGGTGVITDATGVTNGSAGGGLNVNPLMLEEAKSKLKRVK